MLDIVIPMAGDGRRFRDLGFAEPKPFIPIHGRPMVEWVVRNLRPSFEHRFVFICRSSHLERSPASLLERLAPGHALVTVDGLTEGAACTVLAAEGVIGGDRELVIANSDQWVDSSLDEFVADARRRGLEGSIMTMPSEDPKWSYARTDAAGAVIEVAEKRVISKSATVGLYYFRRGGDFVRAARRMIERDIRTNGEFYVAPVYNQMIEGGLRVGAHDVRDRMFGLGTPEDLKEFLSCERSKEISRSWL